MRIINLRQNTPSSDLSGQSTTPSQSIVIGRQRTVSSQRKRFGGQLTPVWPGIEMHNCKSGHWGIVCGTTDTGLAWTEMNVRVVTVKVVWWMDRWHQSNQNLKYEWEGSHWKVMRWFQDKANKINVSVLRFNMGLSQYRSNVLQWNYMLNTFMMIRLVPTHNV